MLFTGTSSVIPESYSSLGNNLQSKIVNLDTDLLEGIDIAQLLQVTRELTSRIQEGTINGEWLEANGLDKNLLEGLDRGQVLEATQELTIGLNEGIINKQWIENYLGNDDTGGLVLIIVLFILLIIIGAAFG